MVLTFSRLLIATLATALLMTTACSTRAIGPVSEAPAAQDDEFTFIGEAVSASR